MAVENRVQAGSQTSSHAGNPSDRQTRPPAPIKTATHDLDEFLKLKERLPKAVCDESVISRAPSLEALRPPGGPDEARQEHWGAAHTFDVILDASESQLLAFLLGDTGGFMAAPAFLAQLNAATSGAGPLKRKVSLDICTALVTPGKVSALATGAERLFLPALPVEGSDQGSSKGAFAVDSPLRDPGQGHAVLRVLDQERRFGKVGDAWYVPGWIESYEVTFARSGRRVYRRIAQAITNRLQFIAVMGADSVPLGFLYLSAEPATDDWSRLKVLAENEASRQRLIELYRAILESDAYRAVGSGAQGKNRARLEAVRRLQEFYRNLMSAYQIYPNETQFAAYARKAKSKDFSEKAAKTLLDAGFFQVLRTMQVNGSYVAFNLFAPDPVLRGMYQEFRRRLEQIP